MKRHFLIQGGLGNQLLQAACFLRDYQDCILDTTLLDSKVFQTLLRQRTVDNYLGYFSFSTELRPQKRNTAMSFMDYVFQKKITKGKKFIIDYGHRKSVCDFLRENVEMPVVSQNKFEIDRQRDVAVHVRGGDYLLSKNSYFYKPDAYYYTAALRQFDDVGRVFLFTDDVSYSQHIFENIKGLKKVLCSTDDELLDFINLTKFQRIICANSTFSLTAALVGKAQFIFPQKYYNDGRLNPFTDLKGASYV